MSSREIAKLTGKNKSDVHVDIWNMLKQLYGYTKDDGKIHHHKNQQVTLVDGVIAVIDNRGYISEFLLDRRHTEILITGYDVVRRAAVIDRWFALESGSVQPLIPQKLPEALRLAADLAERKAELEHQVEEMKPDVDAFERIAKKSTGSMCVTDAAKHLQIKPKILFDTLSSNKWIYRRLGKKPWVGYQDKLQQGLLEHKITVVAKDDGTERVCEQVLVTAKGISKLAKMLSVDKAA
ncbi:phage antirepressor KilAC domain-containing protein [Xenorhabdus sp. BG5]|uniref:phage antirepressor KilAC domain-containing protein n=1 Tax=Xenorhabdus sp. BG5 TaxID=2782014 RepID=UPI001D152444|nr:phage antirepressor KilAC domain-containing protein [Xenorhabdus sp. BG5]